MSRTLRRRSLDPRRSPVPAAVAFLLGLVLFLTDATLSPRPGPVAYLLTPTPVAVLLYVYRRPETGRRRLLVLTVWGFLGTTAAGLGAVLVAIATRLPRPYAAWEFFLLDLGVFVWFTIALSGAFAVGARTRGRWGAGALAAGPVAQLLGFLVVVALTAEDVVLFAVVGW